MKSTLSTELIAADAPILHIRMESSKTCNLEIFFAAPGQNFAAERRIATGINTVNQMVDYYIRMDNHSECKDVISKIRIDAISGTQVHEIDSVQLLK